MIVVDGNKYEELDLFSLINTDVESTEYPEECLKEARKITHWLCKEEIVLEVRSNHLYEVKYIKENNKNVLYILDEYETPSLVWLMLEGIFLIKKRE